MIILLIGLTGARGGLALGLGAFVLASSCLPGRRSGSALPQAERPALERRREEVGDVDGEIACEEAVRTTGRRSEETPARLTTTLYDLTTMVQDIVGPENDALVTATVVHLLHAGRAFWDEHGSQQPRWALQTRETTILQRSSS